LGRGESLPGPDYPDFPGWMWGKIIQDTISSGKGENIFMQDSERESLKEKVLVINDLIAYQTGTVASRMIVFKKAGTLTSFSFDEGEGLSEHTAPYDAILVVTEGEAEVQIAGAPFTVHTGELIILPANKPHAVLAKKRFKMMLTMIREWRATFYVLDLFLLITSSPAKNRSQNGFEDDTHKKNPADPAGIILYLKSKVRTGL
jgi:quercetin dioxygenase-like cupin family protein